MTFSFSRYAPILTLRAKALNPYKKVVGDRIRARRTKIGLTSQDMLADALHKAGAKNVDQSRVSRWENGSLPGKQFRPFLLKVLKLSEQELFGQIEPTPNPRIQPIHKVEPMGFASAVLAALEAVEPLEKRQYLLALIFDDENYVAPGALRELFRRTRMSL
jgi:transcriptional regulator with XRE-family HTH domain